MPSFHQDTLQPLEPPDKGSVYYTEDLEKKQQLEKDKDDQRRQIEGEASKLKSEKGEGFAKKAESSKSMKDESSEGDLDLLSFSGGGRPAVGGPLENDVKRRGGLQFLKALPPRREERATAVGLFTRVRGGLAGLLALCLVFYCLCTPSRSLKKQ